MPIVRWLVGLGVTLVVSWAAFVLLLVLWRPRGVDLSEAKRFVPDVVRLLRSMAADRTLPSGVRRRLGFLLVYLSLPIDLIPDVIPVLGYADDVILMALVLRSVVRLAGPEALGGHWTGSPQGLAVVRRLSGWTGPGGDDPTRL